MHDTHVIKTPLLTEKSTNAVNEANTYTFLVDRRATKDQIKLAVERIYKVRVDDVRTVNRKGKRRRLRYGWVNVGDHKKAMVRLADGDMIELF